MVKRFVVARAGLRKHEDQDAHTKPQQEELRAAVAAGVASGPGKSADAVFDRLEAKYRKLASKRTARRALGSSRTSNGTQKMVKKINALNRNYTTLHIRAKK